MLARQLGQISPGQKLTGVRYATTTGEVMELAISLACHATGKTKVAGVDRTRQQFSISGLISGTGKSDKRDFGCTQRHFKPVPFDSLEEIRSAIDSETACVILEPVQADARVLVPSPGYLKSVREICDRNHCLLVLDGSQTGFGRTGKMFAADYERVVPDILIAGQEMTGGLYPIAAVF